MRLEDHFGAYLHPKSSPYKRPLPTRGSRGKSSTSSQARTYPVVRKGKCHVCGSTCIYTSLPLHCMLASFLFHFQILVPISFFSPLVPTCFRRQIAVNYHKMWHNLPALMAALGLPPHLADTFPKRMETVRGVQNASSSSGGGAAAAGVDTGLSATRAALRHMYAPMVNEISTNPAVLVV